MNSEIKKIDKELEKLLLKNNHEFHQPKVLQKMMFILLISEEEISMEELAKRTRYSLATLSNTIKFAEKINFVERVSHPGTKRVYVKAKNNFYNLVKDTIKSQYESFIPKISKMEEIENKYKTHDKNQTVKRIQLIKDVKKMNDKIKKINKILEED
jgi:DNA-binding transcriptional regulator GbsR (MarR family)